MRKNWTTLLIFVALVARGSDPGHNPRAGPVFVPVDSWIYSALQRLAAMGYAPDAESLAGPWTRQQCAMLVDEAEDIASRRATKVSAGRLNSIALNLIATLRGEFPAGEHGAAIRLDSLYARYSQISGVPLRDSYHFGQTIVNDYGRPYEQGANAIAGFTGYGVFGRFSASFRGEYQQARGRSLPDPAVRAFIAAADQIPIESLRPNAASHSFNPIEAYIGVQLGPFDITAGKQSLWWGPGQSSALHFSNNADPINAIRIAQSMPLLLPGPLRALGRIRTQFIFGRLSGHQFPARPLINAQKITLQVTQNLELGCTRTAIFGGVGTPLTPLSFFRSLFSVSSNAGLNLVNDAGDRRSGFDFRWRVPKLRRYVTVYSDSLADDDPNPLANPRRSAWGPGIAISQLPFLTGLDLQFETYSTLLYANDRGGQFIYWNDKYHDAYTNNSYLLGSWIGRDARAYSVTTTYWRSAHEKLSASFRQTKIGGAFLPGGGTQTDVGLVLQRRIKPELSVLVSLQYERYFVPILGAPRHNLTASLQFSLNPDNWALRRP